MHMHPVNSTSIAAIGYDAQRRVLDIKFRESGEIYRYYDVPPEEYAAFMEATSKGTYLNQQFKLAGYPYERIK